MADGKVVIDVILDDGTVAKGVANIDKRLGGVASAGKRAATGIKEIVTALGLVTVASKAIDMVKQSIDGAIDRYDTLKNFPRVMQLIGFDAEESDKAIQRLSDGIQGLPTRLDQVAKTAQNIAVMTGDLDGAVETTLALNNAFLASGASAADAERGLIQYVQMLAKGKVDANSWMTLQETMGVALNKTAEAFGFTGKSAQNDLYEALKEGHITFDEFNAKIIELSEAQGGFAEMAREASAGIKTAWTNLRTWIVTGVTGVIEAIDEALGGTGSIEDAINRLKPLVFGFFGWVSDMVLKIADGFRKVLDALDPWLPTFEEIKEVVIGFFEDLTSFWQSKGQEILQNATTIFEGVRDTIQTAFDAVHQVISDVLGSKVMPFIQDQLAKIQQFWQENGEQIMQAVENAFKFIQSVIEAVMPAVKFIIEIVWSAIQDIISGALDVIMGLVKVFTGIFTGDFSKMWEGVKQIFKGAIDLIIGWLSLSFIGGIRKLLVDLGKNSLNIVRGMWTNIVNAFKSFGTNATNLVSNMVKGVINFFRNLLNQGISIFQQLRAFKASIWNAIREAVLGVVRGLFNGVRQRFSDMFSTVRNLTHNIKSTIVTIWNEVLSFLRGINLTQIGRDIIQGLINGIGSMASAVVDKVKNIGESIIGGFRNVFQTRSPSRVTMGIGEDVIQGLIDGMSGKQNEADETTKKIADSVVKVTESMNKKIEEITQKSNDEIKKIEQRAQEDIRLIHEKAKKAKRKLTEAEVVRIRRIEEDSAKKIKDIETKLSKDIIKIKEDHQKKIAEINRETFNNSKEWIDERKYYNELSLAEELRAWERVQARYEKGTEERKQADREVYRVRKQITEELTRINEEYTNKVRDLNEKLIADEQRLRDEYNRTLEARTKSLTSFAGLFDEVKQNSEVSGKQLLNNLKGQVDTFREWSSNIQKLSKRGIDQGLLAELQDMGPKAGAEIKALTTLSDKELDEYVSLWREKNRLAKEQATKELEGLRIQTEQEIVNLRQATAQKLDEVHREWEQKMKAVGVTSVDTLKQASAEMPAIGRSFIEGLIDGISSVEGELYNKLNSVASNMRRSFESYVSNTALPGSASNTLAKGPDGKYYTWEEYNKKFNNEGKKSGNALVDGFVEGIKKTEKSAVSAVKKVASGVTGAIKNALGIKSPSRVFAEIGENVVEGLVKGIESTRKLAVKTTEGLAKDIQSPLVDVPINRLRGVTAPIGNVTPISGAFGVGSSITNNNNRAYNPTFNNYFTRDESTPSEVARKNKQQSQRLAMEWGLT